MVSIIAYELDRLIGYTGTNDIVATSLLYKITGQGMLPPSNNYIVRYGSQEMLDGIQVMRESHSWEPEDEVRQGGTK